MQIDKIHACDVKFDMVLLHSIKKVMGDVIRAVGGTRDVGRCDMV